MSKPLAVGVIGCGTISGTYMRNMKASSLLRVVACADEVPERARERAQEFGIPRACSVGELLADDDVELVVNLTIPAAHAPINLAALAAGKHVYTEKPFAATREDGERILEAAAAAGLTVACAPDTVLGAGIQTCLRLLESGKLGERLGGAGFALDFGPEDWHPNPAFFFEPGAGPLFDVGPYYVTTLVYLLGPVRAINGMGRILYTERTPTRGPRKGETFKVSVPTLVSGLIEFESGAQATLVASYGIGGTDLPNMQIYCTDGVLAVPDPNTFGGPVRVRSSERDAKWREVPLLYRHTDNRGNFRGLGVIEAAQAISEKRAPRASGELGYHVLDVMQSIVESAASGQRVKVTSNFTVPPPLPVDAPLAMAK